MTKFGSLALPLALLLALTACPSDDGSSEGETGTETAAETSGETGGECNPPGVYGDCGAGGEAACMSEGGPAQCILDVQMDPTLAVCGRPCADDCDCWAGPGDGEASVACVSLIAGDDGTCILDCAGGASCPSGMSCTNIGDAELCVFNQ